MLEILRKDRQLGWHLMPFPAWNKEDEQERENSKIRN